MSLDGGLPERERFAWHFLPHDERVRKHLPDGTRPRVTPGWTFRCAHPIEAFWYRLDASSRPLDALRYGSGPVACRVRLSGTIYETPWLHRVVATEFTVLAVRNVVDLLNEFALTIAERTLLREVRAGRDPAIVHLLRQLATRRAHLNQAPDTFPRWRDLWSPDAVMWHQAKAERDASPALRQMDWARWTQMVWNEWVATLPGAVAETVAISSWNYGRTGPSFGSLLRHAETAATLSKAAWSAEDEAAAEAAGLSVQPNELNAELEQRLLAAFHGGVDSAS